MSNHEQQTEPAGGASALTDGLGGLVQKPLRTSDLRLMADLMDEASDILAKMPVDVFDAMQIRCYLADELGGSASMLRDEAALRNAPVAFGAHRYGKWGYIWHEEDDVAGWIALMNASLPDPKTHWCGPVALFETPNA